MKCSYRYVFYFLLALASFCIPADIHAQAKMKPGKIEIENLEEELAGLPEEDRETIKGLKFSDPVVSPQDSRRFGFIQGSIVVTNKGERHTIADKLRVEMWALCQNMDREWAVIHLSTPILINEKGRKKVGLSFRQWNSLFDRLNGGKKEKLQGSLTRVYWEDVLIYAYLGKEKPRRGSRDVPENWWEDDSLDRH